MLRVVLLCAVVTIIAGETTSVSQCTDNAGDLPINTYVEGCITPPCQLPQLQDAVIHIVFKSPRLMRTMTTLATAYLAFISRPVAYDLQENAVTCNYLTNTYCPVLKDEVVMYTLRMYMERFFFVGTAVTIEFRVVDHNQEPVLCIRMPLVIVSPVETTDHQLRDNSTVYVADRRQTRIA